MPLTPAARAAIPSTGPTADAILAAYLSRRPVRTLAVDFGMSPHVVRRILRERLTPEQRKQAKRQNMAAGANRSWATGRVAWNKGRRLPACRRPPKAEGKQARHPVWSDRPGEGFPSVAAAARAVAVWPNAILAALEMGRHAAGRRWYSSPPRWAVEAAAAAESTRRAAVRVRTGRLGRVGGPDPAAFERRYGDVDRRRSA